jgi:adenine/guanine/hypoxanthine permease
VTDVPAVTAPALIIVGVMMAQSLGDIAWDDMVYAIPAFVTIIAMPLTYSIATGIALGPGAVPAVHDLPGPRPRGAPADRSGRSR